MASQSIGWSMSATTSTTAADRQTVYQKPAIIRSKRGMIYQSDFPTRSAICRRNQPFLARSSSHPA
jgi:hypothetical protein